MLNKKHSLRESNTKYIFPLLDGESESIDHVPTSEESVILPIQQYFESNAQTKDLILDALKNFNHVFLLGPAGSGKSHIIMDLADQLQGEITSRDAFVTREVYNKGKTLHHLFNNFKTPAAASKLDRLTSYLFIDEVSNMRYSWVNLIDESLRLSHDPNKPFGGVTILWSGDFMQLPPIITGKKIQDKLDAKIFLHPVMTRMIRHGFLFRLEAPIRFLLDDDYTDKESYAIAMKYLRYGKLTPWLKEQISLSRVVYSTPSYIPPELYLPLYKMPLFICLGNAPFFRLHQYFR